MFTRLSHGFLERVCVVLLNGGEDLIDRVEIVDSVVNRAGESISFGKKAECLCRTDCKHISRSSSDCGQAIICEEGFDEAF